MKAACGTVHKFGDNIDTDVIIPARYLNSSDPAELATHCMEDIDKEFVNKVKEGDITAKDTLDLTRALLENDESASPELKQAFRELIRSPEYKQLLNNGITNEFLMTDCTNT